MWVFFQWKLSALLGSIARFQCEKINLFIDIFYNRKIGIELTFSKFWHWVSCIFLGSLHATGLHVLLGWLAVYKNILICILKRYKTFKIHMQVLCAYIRYQNRHTQVTYTEIYVYICACISMYIYLCIYHQQWREIFKIQVINKP